MEGNFGLKKVQRGTKGKWDKRGVAYGKIGEASNLFEKKRESQSAAESVKGVGRHFWQGGASQLSLGRRSKVGLVLFFVVFPKDELIPRLVYHVHDVKTPSTLAEGNLSILR